MRIFADFSEVMGEVKRDLKELAVVYQSTSVQNIDTHDDEGYRTHELMNYTFTLNDPNSAIDWYTKFANNNEVAYADEEFIERSMASSMEEGGPAVINPGEAWTLDSEYWEPLMVNGKFHYTYNERLQSLDEMVDLLWKDKNTRRGWLPIWWEKDNYSVDPDGTLSRVPCSLGYFFMVRDHRLHMHYVMRSCDFIKHFAKDIYLAVNMMAWIREKVPGHHDMGTFTFTAFSLHAFAKDLEGVF